MVELLRHRQTKGAATDMFYLTPPRHISTLPKSCPDGPKSDFRFTPERGLAALASVCPARNPPQSVAAACPVRPGASSLAWAPSHARRSTARRSGRRQSGRRKHARKPTGSPARRGTAHARLSGPAQPSPRAVGDALNAGCRYLEVKCLGCNTHQTVPLDIVRRPKTTPVHELERYMRCRQCSEVRRYPFKRSHLVALRPTKISASDPPSTWWPGER